MELRERQGRLRRRRPAHFVVRVQMLRNLIPLMLKMLIPIKLKGSPFFGAREETTFLTDPMPFPIIFIPMGI